MADRARRARPRQISEVTDDFSEQSASESEQDWDPRKSDSARRAGKTESPLARINSRTKRGGDEKQQSIRLTMKVAPSKLREVTRANEVDSLQDTLGGGRVIDGPRSRRAAATSARLSARAAGRPRYAEYGESDLEEDQQVDDGDKEREENEEEDREDDEVESRVAKDFDEVGAEAEDSSEEQDEEEEEEDDEDDEEEEDDDDDEEEEDEEDDDDEEDVEMEDAPPVPPPKRQPAQPKPPKITLKPPPKSEARPGAKTKITVTPAQVGPLKSVEDQEMEDDGEDDEEEEDEDEDEESSELSEDDDTANLNPQGVEDEELLEEEDIEGEEGILDEDDEMDDDSGDETPASGMATPDPNRLTKRQRGRPEDQGQLMALDMAPQQRKFFTDEEKAMKKDEHARKRKELTKRKILEEKTAALNRLLKPQASKARGAAPKPETLAAGMAAAATEEEEFVERANPLYTRWVSTRDGVRLGVPEEWLGKRVGQVLGPSLRQSNGSLVQEL